MRAFFITFSLLLVQLIGLAQPKAKKAVFIIADGIPVDLIRKLDPPHFREISRIGGLEQTLVGGEKGGYSQTPTISAVGYNSVLTGTWVNKHNVWDNDIAAPNYNYPTIFRLLKMQYPEKKTAIFSSWLDNRTKLVGDRLKETGSYAVDYKLDSLEHDTINFPHDRNSDYMHRIDEKVVDEAARSIRELAPDLTWVYLEYTDDMGHRHGDSPQFDKAIQYMDGQVGRIWDAIQVRQKQFNEDWLIIVTTDHGRDSATGHNHGGQSDREKAGWILTNAKNLNDHFRNRQSGMIDIMPTIARFMDIKIPVAIAREVDGVPLIGPLSLTDPGVKMKNGKASISWKPQASKGTVKIYGTATNNVKTGGQDQYMLLTEVPVAAGKADVVIQPRDAAVYKLVLEGPDNMVNRWIMPATK